MTHMLVSCWRRRWARSQRRHALASGLPASPRQLRTLILTLPSAMLKQEREIFRRRMFEAIAIVWKAMGWHPQDEDFAPASSRIKSVVPVPEIQMEWDEASCGNWSGFTTKRSPVLVVRRKPSSPPSPAPDREPEPGCPAGSRSCASPLST